jgi:hypothetical protein
MVALRAEKLRELNGGFAVSSFVVAASRCHGGFAVSSFVVGFWGGFDG